MGKRKCNGMERLSFRHRTPVIIVDGTRTSNRYIGEVL